MAWLCPAPWPSLSGSCTLGLSLPPGGGPERFVQERLRGWVGVMVTVLASHLRHGPSARRLHKCRVCYKQLRSISGLVKSKSGLSGRHGSAFRELHLLMASLD